MKKKRILALAAAVLAASILSGCSVNADGTGYSKEKTLIYASGDYSAINPALYEHGEINSLIFSGLTARDGDNAIVPSLAESWEFDEATNTYVFQLRDDVKWHDGKAFTSEDVKFTLETIMDPANASEIASNYEEIIQIRAEDDDTVSITLNSQNSALLDYLTIGILPKHILEGKDIVTDEYNRFPIGTGPYKMKQWDKGQSITLVKNEDFYMKEPQIDTIIFKIVGDKKARALQLKSGELDLAQIDPVDAQQFADNKDFTVNVMKTADYRGIMYNKNNPFFKKHKELPNALSYAIDRQQIVDSVLAGYGMTAYSPLQQSEYNNQDMEKFSYDPQRAMTELEAAGWKRADDGIYQKDGDRLSFTINCMEGDQVRIGMANICSQQLKEVGADMKVAVLSRIDWDNQEAFLIGWGSPFDPDDHTYKVFGTDKASNYSGYSNEKVDELLRLARETDIKEERLNYYKEFQSELAKDMPYTFIAYIDAIYISNPSLKGISPQTALGHHGVGIFWNVADWTL